MSFETQKYMPELFAKFLVENSSKPRIIAYCNEEAIQKVGLEGIQQGLKSYLDDSNKQHATFGLIVLSDSLTPDDMRDCVSNTVQKPTTCIWCVLISKRMKSVFGCHTAFKVNTTSIFESECQGLKARGFSVWAERKKYSSWFEFFFIKCNPIWAFRVYNPNQLFSQK